ncbi:MAG: hypothetical protein RJA70_1123 [Pseudomonadota bacterium]|jgi:hypothetical protein
MLSPLPPELKYADRALHRLEAGIALLSRCQPTNAANEQQRVLERWRAGVKAAPEWRYAATPNLTPLRHELAAALVGLPQEDAIGQLYRDRAAELELETRLVEAIGTRDMPRLSGHRFGVHLARIWRDLAGSWADIAVEPATQWIVSDDRRNPSSLIVRMSRVVGELKLPIAVKLSDTLQAAAATGQALILVAEGRRLTAMATERVVVHEVFGHALPRYRAQGERLGLFATGSAGGNDEQEGYALLLEERRQLMCSVRKRELGLRHLAGLSVHDGADWVQTLSLLMARGAELEEGAQIASRVHRAGGLAREVVYLPAWARVRAALSAEPELEEWLKRGRLSLYAISQLRGRYALLPQPNSAITGT